MSHSLLTSCEEAASALERLAATARETLYLCLPRLAPDTALVMPELRERGLQTWADLLALLSRRSPALRILVADADPLKSPARHRNAWANASGLADVLQGEAQLLCAPHGQQASGPFGWLLARHLKPALKALQDDETGSLTPIQRRLLAGQTTLRPAEIHQGFALADGQRAVIGGPGLGSASPGPALLISDGDFAGALNGHFADTWNDAIAAGAPSLAAPATPLATPSRRQSRDDLRLLRTRAAPRRGLAPHTLLQDVETALARLVAQADHRILIRTPALTHPVLIETLCEAAGKTALHLVLLLPVTPPDSWDDRRSAALQGSALDRLRAAWGDRLAARATEQEDGATVCLVDDFAIIGSTALTLRACRWNTEAAALVRDAALCKELQAHLGRDLTGDLDRSDTWNRLGTPLAPSAKPPSLGLLPDALF